MLVVYSRTHVHVSYMYVILYMLQTLACLQVSQCTFESVLYMGMMMLCDHIGCIIHVCVYTCMCVCLCVSVFMCECVYTYVCVISPKSLSMHSVSVSTVQCTFSICSN